ncbi:MAG: hypothetical protein JWN57_2879, partial [Frankiales bacterium]|nr:hypothetical protein [Frankiales bacterium]
MTARHSHHLRRHPGTPEAHRVLRRVGAVLQLLAVLALPPALLLGLVGSPLNPPAQLRNTDALTSAVDDRSVLWLIALAGWLLYAHLLSSLLVEALRQTRGANLRLPLPGLMFGANAALASHLVASLLLTTPLGAGAGDGTGRLTPAVVQVVAVAPASVGGAAAAPPQANDEPAPSPAVAGMAGERVSNVPAGGVPMSDSGSTAGLLQCRVLPPEGRDHDTLWDIAGRHLGDGTRWRDIYALNQGRLMPDGQRLTRASLIYPGWILTLPADAIALDVDRVPLPEQATTPQAAPPSAAHSTANPPAPARPAHAVPDRTDRTPPVLAAPTSDATGSGAAPTSPALPAAGPSGQPGRSPAPSASAGAPTAEPALVEDLAQESAQESDADYQLPLAGLLTAGSLGLLVALTRRRKVAARRRPPGVRVALPGPDLIEQECQLREEARRADDIAATLRLALHLAVRTTPPAQIQAVWQHPDRSLELCWTDSGAHTPVPAPFQPTERGWLLPADAHRLLWAARQGAGKDGTAPRSGPPELTDDQGRAELVAGLDRRADDPFPLLTPVGTRHGSACLVNLEAFRIVSLTGPPGPAQAPAATHLAEADLPAAPPHAGPEEVVSAWVQALGGAPWASGVRAYVPPRLADLGIGLDRVEVNADRGPLYALTGEQLEQVHDHGSHLAARLADAEFAEDILELYAGYHQAELPAGAL